MTEKLFLAYTTDLLAPGNWRPYGTPQSGDVASIGKAFAIGTGLLPSGVAFGVFTNPDHGQFGALQLDDATIPFGTTISEDTSYGVQISSSLGLAGTVDNEGTISFSGPEFETLSKGSTLLNRGAINLAYAGIDFAADPGGASLVNDGVIRVIRFDPAAPNSFSLPVGGTGTITVSQAGRLEFRAPPSSGQSIRFSGGAGASATVQIDQSGQFTAAIQDFAATDKLVLANISATSLQYVATGAGSGVLQVLNGAAMTASLRLLGLYGADDFSLSQGGSSVTITTDVTDPATGSTAPPRTTGLYRFFDTVDGTHFIASSVAERDQVLVGRPELLQESNGFGAITTATTATETVFRFFDTVHGTHFLTTAAAERDAVIATRPDLVYEPGASFLEDGVAQTGDVAVYRLFSRTDGTHLYTASPAELATLTTPGNAGYRGDLVPEGVAFYAPSGQYL